MSTQTPTPETAIRRAVQRALSQVRVMLPGIVQTYDAAKCEASVQLALLEPRVGEDGVRAPVRMPVVNHVPVWFQGGGDGRLTFPVAPGDECVLIFASSSIERWLEVGGEVDPADGRHHDLSDAVALVGGHSFANAKAAHATATVLEGADVRLGAQTAVEPVIKGNAFASALSTFLAALNTFAGTCTTVPGGTAAALATAATALNAAVTASKSTTVKVAP